MEIRVAVAKVDQFTSPEHADQVELIERPNGGLSIIMAEGKLDGRRSREVARKVVNRLLALLFEGIHDGAATRAVLAKNYKESQGGAEVSLSLLSCDLETHTIILTKNHSGPVILIHNDQGEYISNEGIRGEPNPLNPSVYQFQIEQDFIVIMFTDGISNAGGDFEQRVEWRSLLESVMEEEEPTVQELADFILNQAIAEDSGQPQDDMCVVVVKVSPQVSAGVRRMSVVIPL